MDLPQANEYPSQDLYELSLKGNEPDDVSMADVSAFLYDLNLLYKITRLTLDERYQRFSFRDDRDSIYPRRSRILADEHQLRVIKLTLSSPVELVTAVAVAAGVATVVGTFVGALIKLYNLPLERENKVLDRDIKQLEKQILEEDLLRKLRDRYSSSKSNPFEFPQDFDITDEVFQQAVREVFQYRGSLQDFDYTQSRLHESPIQVSQVELRRIRRERLLGAKRYDEQTF
jgi:hypothetical protein